MRILSKQCHQQRDVISRPAIREEQTIITQIENADLMESLATFETCLETPLVPGELESWAENARKSLEQVAPRLRDVIDNNHGPVLKQIVSEDPGLQGRVDDLRVGDAECIAELESVTRTFETLDEIAAAIEPDETKLKQQLDELIEQGLKFVIQVRTQVVSVRTWLQEAFDRDRGVVD